MRRGLESGWSREARLALASAAALLLPLVAPLAMGGVFTRDDFGALHLPFRFLYQEALRSGQLLLWTPAYHSGFYLFGAGEAGMAHPLHVALYRVFPLGLAFNLEIIGNYLLLFAGTALFWRRMGLSIAGAIVAAMTFAFSGFTIFNAMHVNHIGTLAHAPWMLLAAHVLITSPVPQTRALAFGGLAVATGLQQLAGNPQYVWLTGIAMLALLAYLVWQGDSWRRLAAAAAALACGGLIGALQILPTLEFLANSTRDGWTRDMALSFSLSPLNLLQLWSPFAFEYRVVAPPSEEFIVHEFVVYNGALCSAALFIAMFRPQMIPQRSLRVALLMFAGLNLLLAFGRHGPFYPWLVDLPGVRSLRAPTRHLLLVQLAVSGLAGLLVDRLRTIVSSRERVPWATLWPLGLLIALSAVTTVVAASLAGSDWAAGHGLRFSRVLRGAPWALIVIGIVGLIGLAARGQRWALGLVIVATAVDLGLWGNTYLYRWGRIQTLDNVRAEATAPPDAQPGDVIATYPGGRDGYAILRGVHLTIGYTGLYARQVLDSRAPATQRLAGLTWQGDGERWQRVPDPLPRARLLTRAIVTDDPRAMLDSIDVSRVALVENPVDVGGEPGSVEILDEAPGHFRLRTRTTAPQLLALTERFHRSWQMHIDGQFTQALPLYGDFLGGLIPAGEHEVVLAFLPDSVINGRRVAALGVVLTVAGVLWLRREQPASA